MLSNIPNKENLSWKDSFKKLYLDIFAPLLSEEWRREYLMNVGLNPDRVSGDTNGKQKKEKTEKEIEAVYKSIDTFQSKAKEGEGKFLKQSDLAQWKALFTEFNLLFRQIRALVEIIRSEEDEFTVEDYLRLLIDSLTISYFRIHSPGFYVLLELTGVITEEKVTVARLLDIVGGLRFINDLHTEDEARQFSDSLFLNLAILLIVIDHEQVLHYGWDPLPEQLTAKYPNADRLSRRMLSLYFKKVLKIEKDETEALETTFDLSLLVLPESQGGPYLLLYLDTQGEFILRLNKKWSARTRLDLPGGMLRLLNAPALTGDSDMGAGFRLYSGLEEATPDPISIFEGDSGSFKIGKFLVEGEVSNKGYDIKAVARNCVLELTNTEGDGFLNTIIGDGTQVQFDFGIGYTDGRWYLVGGLDLTVALHLNKEIWGLHLRTLHLALRTEKQTQQQLVQFESSLSFSLDIGPVLASVERLGLQMQLPVPEGGLKDIDADQLDFGPKWPRTGVGFSVDAKVVKGGGFLRMDPEKGDYLGFAELKITELFCLDNVALKALAIINTQLPDGQDGYSFLMMISTEFDPIQLGYGFTLNGVGGIIGLHRGLNLDKIRAGIKGEKYDYVLFPKDPLANLPLILTGLNDILPIEKDHYTFGLMGIIGWGTPQILEIKLGLLFEVPAWKFALIGVAKAEIKRKKKVIARLRMDFAIIYDPTKSLFSIDGSLNYSKLLSWKLTGDVAVRIQGGDDPFFLYSVGGFHKTFPKPENIQLPDLKKVKVALAAKDPKIQAELFFTITSNWVQFGMSAHASYKKCGIGFEAELGFAAIIKFDPFEFEAKVWGSVYLKFFGASFGLELRGTVKGPRPLVIDLYVKFKIWIWTKEVRVPTITIGEGEPEQLETIAVAPILVSQLEDQRNWQPVLPGGAASAVTLRSSADGTASDDPFLKFHPIGDIIINQSQVPLQQQLDRYGQFRPEDYHHFSLELEGQGQQSKNIQASFAPAQYFDMSEEEVFQSRPFEKYDSGVRIRTRHAMTTGSPVEKPGSYEEIIFDIEQQVISKAPDQPEVDGQFDELQAGNSIVRSASGQQQLPLNRIGYRRQENQYVVIDGLTGTAVPEMDGTLTRAEAQLLLREIGEREPGRAGRLEVVVGYELSDV